MNLLPKLPRGGVLVQLHSRGMFRICSIASCVTESATLKSREEKISNFVRAPHQSNAPPSEFKVSRVLILRSAAPACGVAVHCQDSATPACARQDHLQGPRLMWLHQLF